MEYIDDDGIPFLFCLSTRSCSVVDSRTLSIAAFTSPQISRVTHSSDRLHTSGWSTHSTGRSEPSRICAISIILMSLGFLARVMPPLGPLVLRIMPPEINGLTSCSRYGSEISCLL